jgi:cell division protein FtsI/penicillin-binding protein 2
VRRGFKPCSTIKLVTGVAGLSEKVIQPSELALASDSPRMDLTSALAHSDNSYFERVGSGIGFDKMIHYAKELGLGEKTGANVQFEYAGRLPEMGPGFALHRMFSYADGFEVTALQLGNLVIGDGQWWQVAGTPNTKRSGSYSQIQDRACVAN